MAANSFYRALPWAALESVSGAAISIASLLILAKILTPAEFGIVAYAQAIVGMIVLFTGIGLTEAIVQRHDLNETHKSSAFWCGILLSLVGFAVCIAIAAGLYVQTQDSIQSLVLLAEGASLLFFGLTLIPNAMLMRELRMAELTRRTIFSKLVYMVVAISLALAGYGIWSIVIGNIAMNIVGTITIWIGYPYRPHERYSYQHLKQLVKYGAPIMLENVLWASLTRVFSILLGNLHGKEALGFFSLASKATDAVGNLLQSVSGKLALPTLSKFQHDLVGLKKTFMKGTEVSAFISFPIFLGMCLTARDWVPIFLGQKWEAAIPMVQIICLSWLITFSRVFVGTTVRAVGNTSAFILPAFVASISTIAAVAVTAHMPVIFAIYAWLSRMIVTTPLGGWIMIKTTGISAIDQIKPLVRPLICSMFMIATIYLVESCLPASFQIGKNVYHLVVIVTAGIISYTLPALYFYKNSMRSIIARFA